MAYQETMQHITPISRPSIATVATDRPLLWLKKGWSDLAQHPGLALGYGFMVAAIYGAIVSFAVSTQYYHVGVQLTAGFVLLAPLFAAGLYAVSRAIENDKSVNFGDTFRVWGRNSGGLLGMGLILVTLFLFWFMVSMQVTAFLADGTDGVGLLIGAESWGAFFTVMTTQLSGSVILGYLAMGLAGVLVAFAVSAVSIPLLMDRPETDSITALASSWNAVVHNWKPMSLWAVMIAVITGISLALFYVGLIVIIPWLAFATWHAYRDTLGEWKEGRDPTDGPYY